MSTKSENIVFLSNQVLRIEKEIEKVERLHKKPIVELQTTNYKGTEKISIPNDLVPKIRDLIIYHLRIKKQVILDDLVQIVESSKEENQ